MREGEKGKDRRDHVGERRGKTIDAKGGGRFQEPGGMVFLPITGTGKDIETNFAQKKGLSGGKGKPVRGRPFGRKSLERPSAEKKGQPWNGKNKT